jgi:hypothetical protein
MKSNQRWVADDSSEQEVGRKKKRDASVFVKGG